MNFWKSKVQVLTKRNVVLSRKQNLPVQNPPYIIFIYYISCCITLTRAKPNLIIKQHLGCMRRLTLALHHWQYLWVFSYFPSMLFLKINKLCLQPLDFMESRHAFPFGIPNKPKKNRHHIPFYQPLKKNNKKIT